MLSKFESLKTTALWIGLSSPVLPKNLNGRTSFHLNVNVRTALLSQVKIQPFQSSASNSSQPNASKAVVPKVVGRDPSPWETLLMPL